MPAVAARQAFVVRWNAAPRLHDLDAVGIGHEAALVAGGLLAAEKGLSMPDVTNGRHWVGFDLGGTKIVAVVVDAKFQPLFRKRRKTRGDEDSTVGMNRVINTIEKALEEGGLAK